MRTHRSIDRDRTRKLIGDEDPVDRVARAFDAITNIDDPAIFISTTDRERSLAAVDPALPLAGVTFAAKNNIDVAGLATTAGCPSYAYDPGESAIVVQRLTNAGATCIGATNLERYVAVGRNPQPVRHPAQRR
jgi:allophanate hydrolase